MFVRRGGNDNVRFVKSESFVFDALFKIVPFPFFFADVSGLILRQVAFVFFVAEGVAGHQHDRAAAGFLFNFGTEHIGCEHTVAVMAFNNFNAVDAAFFFVEVIQIIDDFRQQGNDFFFGNKVEMSAGGNTENPAADNGTVMPLLFNRVVNVFSEVMRGAAELRANPRIYAAGYQIDIIVIGVGSQSLNVINLSAGILSGNNFF